MHTQPCVIFNSSKLYNSADNRLPHLIIHTVIIPNVFNTLIRSEFILILKDIHEGVSVPVIAACK